MQPVLDVTDLRKSYGSKTAVDGLTFSVGRGEIVGLLGPNGAGKTTTINMMLGVLSPTSGSIRVNGIDLGTERSRAMSDTNFAAVYANLPGNLTVFENLKFFGLMYAVDDLHARIDAAIAKFNLEKFRKTRVGLLSSGENTRVALAKAMLNRPRLLLLDEPTASLDPATARDIRTHIRDFATSGDSGVLWTSHNMYEVQDVCDRVLFMAHGRILLEGDPRTLPAQHGEKTLEDLFIKVARIPLDDHHAMTDRSAA